MNLMTERNAGSCKNAGFLSNKIQKKMTKLPLIWLLKFSYQKDWKWVVCVYLTPKYLLRMDHSSHFESKVKATQQIFFTLSIKEVERVILHETVSIQASWSKPEVSCLHLATQGYFC